MTWLVPWTVVVVAAADAVDAVVAAAMIAVPKRRHRAHNMGMGPRTARPPPRLPPFANEDRAFGNGIPVAVVAAVVAAVVVVAEVPPPRDAVVPRRNTVPRHPLERPCRRRHRRFRGVCRRALPDNASRRQLPRRNCTDRHPATCSGDGTAADAVVAVVVRLDDDEFLLEIDVQFLNQGQIVLRTTWYYDEGDRSLFVCLDSSGFLKD